MATESNPFPVKGYLGPEWFCDRKTETVDLVRNLNNGVNTTLTSLRRMGKTGLLFHVQETLKRKKTMQGIYIDAYSLENLKEFTNAFASAIMKAFPENKPVGKKIMEWIKSLRPIISFDPITGSPEVTMDFVQQQSYEHTLSGLFALLENQSSKVVVIIDEFQQVSTFPEKNIEARLRTLIQPLKKTTFIFSGSDQHLLSEMFNNTKRPFFASTQLMHLKPIKREIYVDFISEKFAGGKRKINAAAVAFILDFTRMHTFYTQTLCNRIYSSGIRDIKKETAEALAYQLLGEQEVIYFQYRNLLTTIQWNLLKAIAAEDAVYQPTSKDFINAHNLESASQVQKTLQSLLAKEMIYRDQNENGSFYRVYDCFLSRWLALQ